MILEGIDHGPAQKLTLAKQLNEWACEVDLLSAQLSIAVTDSEKSINDAVTAFLRLTSAVQDLQARPEGDLSKSLMQVTSEVDCVVSALQFHDLLRQRLEHIADTLNRSSAQHRTEANKLAIALHQPDNLFDRVSPPDALKTTRDEDRGVSLFCEND